MRTLVEILTIALGVLIAEAVREAFIAWMAFRQIKRRHQRKLEALAKFAEDRDRNVEFQAPGVTDEV